MQLQQHQAQRCFWPKEIVELKKFPLQYIIKALALNVFWQRFQRATQKDALKLKTQSSGEKRKFP